MLVVNLPAAVAARAVRAPGYSYAVVPGQAVTEPDVLPKGVDKPAELVVPANDVHALNAMIGRCPSPGFEPGPGSFGPGGPYPPAPCLGGVAGRVTALWAHRVPQHRVTSSSSATRESHRQGHPLLADPREGHSQSCRQRPSGCRSWRARQVAQRRTPQTLHRTSPSAPRSHCSTG